MDNPSETKRTTKGKFVLMIIVGLLLICAVTALSLFMVKEQNNNRSLQSKVSRLEKERSSLSNKITEPKKGPAAELANSSSQWREIPELGVKYKLTPETKSLTYGFISYDGENDGISFSSVELIKAAEKERIKLSASEVLAQNNCESGGDRPTGIISRYAPGQAVVSVGEEKPIESYGNDAKKVGNYYFLYEAPQSTCSESDAVTNLQDKAIKAAKAAVTSFRPI